MASKAWYGKWDGRLKCGQISFSEKELGATWVKAFGNEEKTAMTDLPRSFESETKKESNLPLW